MSDIDYPTYTLDKFNVKGIKGNIKGVKVDIIREIRYKQGPKEGEAFKCTVALSDKTKQVWFNIWKIEADLPFIVGDFISISEVEADYNSYFEKFELKKCKASIIIVHDKKTVNTGETVKISKTKSTEPMIKTETVYMPHNPNTIESKYLFYPAFDYPQLRTLHANEHEDAVRAHIELVMQNKQIIDLLKEMMNK